MTPRLLLSAAQFGRPIQRAEGRDVAVGRMVRLAERAHRRGVQLVAFPELAPTSFFPRWYEEDVTRANGYYEHALPSDETVPLFGAARRLGFAFHLDCAERAPEGRHFDAIVFVDSSDKVVLRCREVHLPEHLEWPPPDRET